MADTNKNNVSINVEINASGQQQLNQYKGAFDSLRTSITNLSNPIIKLDDDVSKLTSSIDQLSKQNSSVGDSVIKVNAIYNALSDTYKGLKEAIAMAKLGVISFEAALTGGLSIVIAFLPQIIEITKRFLSGNDAVSTMAQNFKNLNEVMKAANKDAAEQTTKLNLLYKAATGVNTTGQDRLKYAQQLKDTYPEQFKNFAREQIANGKAKTAYIDLAKSILVSAKAKAALNKMSEDYNIFEITRSVFIPKNLFSLPRVSALHNKTASRMLLLDLPL